MASGSDSECYSLSEEKDLDYQGGPARPGTLIYAIRKDAPEEDLLLLLDEGADVNMIENEHDKHCESSTALEWVAPEGRFYRYALKWIILAGANIDRKDNPESTALTAASEFPGELCAEKNVRTLVIYGADVNHCDFYDRTALIAAAVNGRNGNTEKTTRFLLDSGASVHVASWRGTILMRVTSPASKTTENTLKMLIEGDF